MRPTGLSSLMVWRRADCCRQCSLPLTGKRVVDRVITELAVMDVTPDGLVLKERAPGVTAEEIQKATEAELIIPGEVPEMTL